MTTLRWPDGDCSSGGAGSGVLAAGRLLLKIPHPDVTVKAGSVLDLQPAHVQVSIQPGGPAQGQLVSGGERPLDLALHRQARRLEQGFDRRSGRDLDVAGDAELTLGMPLNAHVPIVCELALQAVAGSERELIESLVPGFGRALGRQDGSAF